MPRRDIYHEVVKRALIADGWTITHDPYPLPFGEESLFVDLGAEMPLGAEKAGRKIAVEAKSFLGRSPMTEVGARRRAVHGVSLPAPARGGRPRSLSGGVRRRLRRDLRRVGRA